MPVKRLHFHGNNGALQSCVLNKALKQTICVKNVFIIKLLEELLQPKLY